MHDGQKTVHYIASFDPDMNAECIKNIIRELALKGHASVLEHNMLETKTGGIAFGIQFQTLDDDQTVVLARSVLAQQWEGLLVLPRVWHVQSIWDLAEDPTCGTSLRLVMKTNACLPYSATTSGQSTVNYVSSFQAPTLPASMLGFFSLYPELKLLSNEPL